MNPGEGRHHVMEPLVALHPLPVQAEPAQTTQAVVECYLILSLIHTDQLSTDQDDFVGVHKLLRSVDLSGTATCSEPSTINPNHYRQRILASLDGGIEVQIQTVLLTCQYGKYFEF